MTEKKARPWDILNKNMQKVDEKLKEERMSVCKSCEHFISATSQCKKCGCFMKLKTQLPHSTCPESKWLPVPVSFREVQ